MQYDLEEINRQYGQQLQAGGDPYKLKSKLYELQAAAAIEQGTDKDKVQQRYDQLILGLEQEKRTNTGSSFMKDAQDNTAAFIGNGLKGLADVTGGNLLRATASLTDYLGSTNVGRAVGLPTDTADKLAAQQEMVDDVFTNHPLNKAKPIASTVGKLAGEVLGYTAAGSLAGAAAPAVGAVGGSFASKAAQAALEGAGMGLATPANTIEDVSKNTLTTAALSGGLAKVGDAVSSLRNSDKVKAVMADIPALYGGTGNVMKKQGQDIVDEIRKFSGKYETAKGAAAAAFSNVKEKVGLNTVISSVDEVDQLAAVAKKIQGSDTIATLTPEKRELLGLLKDPRLSVKRPFHETHKELQMLRDNIYSSNGQPILVKTQDRKDVFKALESVYKSRLDNTANAAGLSKEWEQANVLYQKGKFYDKVMGALEGSKVAGRDSAGADLINANTWSKKAMDILHKRKPDGTVTSAVPKVIKGEVENEIKGLAKVIQFSQIPVKKYLEQNKGSLASLLSSTALGAAATGAGYGLGVDPTAMLLTAGGGVLLTRALISNPKALQMLADTGAGKIAGQQFNKVATGLIHAILDDTLETEQQQKDAQAQREAMAQQGVR